jgi:cation diffusion facilitator CzcD-associated flavoprotein CzcO
MENAYMHVTIGNLETTQETSIPFYDAIVVGAGPYGLSAAAHLQKRGLKVAIFGKPMGFWRDHMPQGMRMRSHWWATNLSDPARHYDLTQYAKAHGPFEQDPFWLDTFIDYGLWFQKLVVPTVDETYITEVDCENGHFVVTLADGRVLHSTTVVMAVGLAYYANRPAEYAHLPTELVSHSMDHNRVDKFAGKHVVVIGGGQSAFEMAALMHERGTSVELVIRRPIRWVPVQNPKVPALLRQLRAPKAGMGVGWSNLIMEKYPYFFHRWPQSYKDHFLLTRHVSAASPWLKERTVGKVLVHDAVQVQQVTTDKQTVQLTLSNGETLQADHLMLATGYQADVSRLSLLHTSVIDAIQTYMGYPVLTRQFESSVPGLYFVGFSSQRSFGPLYRFVTGVEPAARGITQAIAQQVAVTQ